MVDYLELARQKVRVMMAKNLPLPAIERGFNMNEYKDWDRTEHLGWTRMPSTASSRGGSTRYPRRRAEAQWCGDESIAGRPLRHRQDGRARSCSCGFRPTPMSRGIADRTQLKAGMKVSALYQIPEGVNPHSVTTRLS